MTANLLDRFRLDGRIVLVTGASRGLGAHFAALLAQAGASVALAARRTDKLQPFVDGIARTGGRARALAMDVTDAASVARGLDELASWGSPDVVVNNAGVTVTKPLLEQTEADYDAVIDTNLKGCFLCTQQAARSMKQHGGGSIVNLGSGCNKLAFPSLVAYTASKGGIEMFTKEAAVELGEYGIRVNCIAPGSIESERTRHEDPDYAGTWSKLTPLGRVGTAADIAPTVVFLASPGASFISGQTIWIDGALGAS